MSYSCSPARPWGLHVAVRNDEQCGRCGWTAPGPIGDARAGMIRQGDDSRTASANSKRR